MKQIILPLLAALILPLSAGEPSRTWTDTKGRKMDGTLKDKSATEAVLMLNSGKRVTLKLASLSEADREYIAAASLLPDPVISAKTVKIESDARKSQKDERGVEFSLKKVHGRKFTVVFHWLGTKDGAIAIYKTDRRELSDDSTSMFKVAYTSTNKEGVKADYKGYVVGLLDESGNWIAKDASQKPFVRFLDAKARE